MDKIKENKTLIIAMIIVVVLIILGITIGVLLSNKNNSGNGEGYPEAGIVEEAEWVDYLLAQRINSISLNVLETNSWGYDYMRDIPITKDDLKILLKEMTKGRLTKSYYDNYLMTTPVDIVISYTNNVGDSYTLKIKNASSLTSDNWDFDLMELIEEEKYELINEYSVSTPNISYDYLWDYIYYTDNIIEKYN